MIPLVVLPPNTKIEDLDAKGLKDGNTVYHLLTQDGMFIRHVNQLYRTTQKVTKSDVFGKAEEFCTILFKPIPRRVLDEMTAFGKAIYEKHKAECAMILYYNVTTREWAWDVPEQETSVNGLSVDYQEPPPAPPGFVICGSCHTHANAMAFQSGVDHRDEQHFDGVHITIGNLGTTPSYHVRLIAAGATWNIKDEGDLIEKAIIPELPVKPELVERVKPKTYSNNTVYYSGKGYDSWDTRVKRADAWFAVVIPSAADEQPKADYHNGLWRAGARVSPIEAAPEDSDRLGSGTWWGGEYFVKIGREKGQWKLLTKAARGEMWRQYNQLTQYKRVEIYDAFNNDELRFAAASFSEKDMMERIHKRAEKILKKRNKDDKQTKITTPAEGAWGDPLKDIQGMTEEEWEDYCKKEYGI